MSDHYDGAPWLDINLMDTLKGVTAQEASKSVGRVNTISQIVNHIIGWRKTILKRLHNENIPAPANNFIENAKSNSAEEWEASLLRLQQSQNEWLTFLSLKTEINFDEKIVPGNYSCYELIQGILQHDAYHL